MFSSCSLVLFRFYRLFPLFVIVIEDDRTILSSVIRTLAVQLGRVMNSKERAQELLVTDHLGVKKEMNDFGVARPFSAYLLVSGILLGPTHESHFGRDDPLDIHEFSFHVPEATGSESSLFVTEFSDHIVTSAGLCQLEGI